MPWCILYSSMVSFNNLCVLHGPAGWGESSGCAKPLWAQVLLPCWRVDVHGQVQPVITFLHPPAAQGDGGAHQKSLNVFHPVEGRRGSTSLVRSPYGDETSPRHVGVNCWHDRGFVWHPKSPGKSTPGSRCFFVSAYLHSSLSGFEPN